MFNYLKFNICSIDSGDCAQRMHTELRSRKVSYNPRYLWSNFILIKISFVATCYTDED